VRGGEQTVELATGAVLLVLAPPWVVPVSEEVVLQKGVVQERLESGIQEAGLAQIEETTLALAWKCGGIFERCDVFLPRFPGLVGFARTLLVWTL
jgi:hypothetical protein